MTTKTDPAAERVKEAVRVKWMESLYDLWVFFDEHPEMIDGMGVTVSGWVHDDKHLARERVVQFVDRLGPCSPIPMSDGSSYVQVHTDVFDPHTVAIYAIKEAVGHKVQDAVPEKWEWDALQH